MGIVLTLVGAVYIVSIYQIGEKLMPRTKGQERKYQAILKSVGGNSAAANKIYKIWSDAQPRKKKAVTVDAVAAKLEAALAPLVKDKSLQLGNKGYTIKRAKGKGAKGFSIIKNK